VVIETGIAGGITVNNNTLPAREEQKNIWGAACRLRTTAINGTRGTHCL